MRPSPRAIASALLLTLVFAVSAGASTLYYDFHYDEAATAYGFSYPAADIVFSSDTGSDSYTYYEGSIDGYAPATLNYDATSALFYANGGSGSPPLGDISGLVFTLPSSGPTELNVPIAARQALRFALLDGVPRYIAGAGTLTILDEAPPATSPTTPVPTPTTSPSTPAPTPEPGSLLLVGTGVLGIAGLMRRRLFSIFGRAWDRHLSAKLQADL